MTILLSLIATIIASLAMTAIPIDDDATCTTDSECYALFGDEPDLIEFDDSITTDKE